MGEEPPTQASAPVGTVFLSYASQDVEAARRICDALRAAGMEVWFDQSELRGGDAWDQSIRKQIKTCALFVPIISANTHARAEGYFRLEWNLAVDRCQRLAADKAFLVPVVVDDTPDDDERVPEKFRDVQWTRLPVGETPPGFVRRIQQLLSGEVGASPSITRAPSLSAPGRSSRFRPAWLALAVGLAAVAAYLLVEKPWNTKPPPPVPFDPPPHSIAVLPFVNMSGDATQEYFSDGLTEELLNSLSRINGLQVAARTSSFSFEGEHPDVETVAHKLNVAAVLEGSVRRSAHTVRITAQLINGSTGYDIWSQSYDRNLDDVLALQTEIATAVAGALKATLLGDVAAKLEAGGTRNPAAFEAYLRARKAGIAVHSDSDAQTAIAAYTEAIRLDPNYALAFAGRSLEFNRYAEGASDATDAVIHESFDEAEQDALKAIALAPDLAEGHLALAANFKNRALDFTRANEEYERALALAPGNARVQGDYGRFAVMMGHKEPGIAAVQRAVLLDPLNPAAHSALGSALYYARRYQEATAALQDSLALDPDNAFVYGVRGLAYYALGNLQSAETSCESKPDYWYDRLCLAIVYDKRGRHADAESVLTKLMASVGDRDAFVYAEIHAQWGNTVKGLEWLERAHRLGSSDLVGLKTDPLLDPLRNDPRFRAVERALKFPD
jgi:TolB-like protein/Tfp pilus assembly protein PilF